jgi:hypothetical protein
VGSIPTLGAQISHVGPSYAIAIRVRG